MSLIKIYSVIGIENFTLVVFNTQIYFWQFRLVSADGAVFGEQRLYYTPQAAAAAGRKCIQVD
ncbi:hypothetical protein VF14_20755 [Nostoc linckia z18]|uniref:Uncharacterized protein n=2 Tax=Nostoc linckia TaxID=92942 RepID=A0A9Q5ZAR0_NOSLI|nr:hypothetical protein [Nostoc linckia]PHK40815.1 hypothetical protein VF12_09110 [Nostoc linckia z15]PHK44764.1 hypothetical protein VF13_20180 [Nostoc linckia z16]PHJ57641.1 hypothetical protein VF02_29850 [Nostoc linckia z1]PHJ59875.1 hypothetical protein VF05_31535 [Nostoc linckia z3]PHJ64730.1 hypothetical protein VF03_28785 [Nostoc linckia z2]